MRRISILITAIAFVFSGLALSPANAVVPADGTYNCNTGVASTGTPNYRVTGGVVTDGGFCTGSV
ncbi:MAG: hypothetical protein WCQ11_05095, partial [Actinomycetes bacterium]